MACNCKNKKTEPSKITPSVDSKVKINSPVTLQEINIIENMVVDINTNNEKRAYVTEFFMRVFGDPIINYCDQVCQKRLVDKLRNLKKTI